jgi:hypothetical protein
MARSSPLPVPASEREALLASPLGTLLKTSLIAHCGALECPPPRPIPVADVMAASGNKPLAHVLDGLFCTACGTVARSISLRADCQGGWIVQPVVVPQEVLACQ